jgi:PAS domain S-box-containing protein
MKLSAGISILILAVLVCVNEIFDLPHYLFNTPPRDGSWLNISILLIGIIIFGVFFLGLLDIKEKQSRKANLSSEKSRKLLSAILGGSPAAILFIKNDKAVWVSKVVEDILGWSVKKWLKEPSVEFIYPDKEEFDKMHKHIAENIRKKERLVYECEYMHKDGHRVPTLVSLQAINKNNLKEGFIFSLIDNTEQKKAKDTINSLNKSLEEKIKERTKELDEKVKDLERFRQATVDREFRMKELTEKIKKLSQQKK